MLNRTCCMVGQREIGEEEAYYVAERLRGEILTAIHNGFHHFICSFDNVTDLLFADIVVELMNEYPFIILEAAISHVGKLETTNILFQRLIDKCKVVGVTSLEQDEYCMKKRNYLMLDFSQMVIAFSNGNAETLELIHYAKSKDKEIKIINI